MILNIVVALYGLTSILASLVHGRKKSIQPSSAGLMLLGGLLLCISIFFSNTIGLGLLIGGGVFVHVSAIMNGYMMYGKINKKHHLIRFLVTLALVIMKVISI